VSIFPALSGEAVIKALGKYGFTVVRIAGSHHILRHPDGRRTTVPVHRGEIVRPGALAAILRDCRLKREDLS
jgi:predicted RNA binding protein YcfA (HicA-like mRNA interferase family)